ncbi:glycosyltransferase family 4 protein [Streptomyces sp. ME08-AFT2]|uniref:CATRA conflict system CASPASE/TPR repeat-associated protein n=1 Tax=Streptomyces sp. ME08-AFT2 TaxID=3028683 RepID=UPI0029B4C602|nr:CATRA conflict system CASPASE/TPR repeat-associated protein [Streptomyces sp. ME08-AFT2]MDX3310007.1 glycosyltransferase family 4 protein [Streptomyces sp. ME08-AFT2]
MTEREATKRKVTEQGVTEQEAAEQEVVAHVFVPLDRARAEEGVASLRAMWRRFRELQEARAELYPTLPVRVPKTPPAPSVHGSVVVAGVQSADLLDQAILRRHHGVLNLSILLGAGPGREWPGLRERVRTIVGSLGACHLGSVTLELGKLPEGTPGDVDLSEPEGSDASQPERLLRMLGRIGADARLGSWAWSTDHRPKMPDFVRYLMHMTALRHQWATHHRLGEARAAGRDGKLAEVHLPYWGSGPDELADAEAELRFMRHVVETLEENARHALDDSGLGIVGPLLRDRRFSSSFVQRLDDLLALRELAGPPKPKPVPAPELRPRVTGRSRVLAVVDEWFPAHGGLSAFNRGLCIALAEAGADVRVLVVSSTPAEQSDATDHDVRLIDAARPGILGKESLFLRPPLTDGFEPDLVIGHGRDMGLAARHQVAQYFPDAGRLHFLHVEPDRAEAQKPDAKTDLAVRSQERTERELELCEGALRSVAVGPRLAQNLRRHLRTRSLAPLLRVDPGFDTRPAARPPGPDEIPQILMMGRLEDAPLKGLDIACRALGAAVPQRAENGSWELLIRGVPAKKSRELKAQVEDWVGNPAVDVTLRPFSADPRHIMEDVARASLVLMPSRAEAFGLVGAEAIAAGVPVLVSGRSGLGRLLLAEEGLPVAQQAVVDVAATARDLEADVRLWEKSVHAVMHSLPAAFRDAAELRLAMAARHPWATAANAVLGCADPHDTV